jgi:mannose-1-phosphate guanylyltransferase
VRTVSSFVEKPDPSTAELLQDRGALVNSLMLAARGEVLIQLFVDTVPEIVALFASYGRDGRGGAFAGQDLYRRLPTRDFSRDVLAFLPERLLVYPAPASCGWSDLGTPRRLSRFLDRKQSKIA